MTKQSAKDGPSKLRSDSDRESEQGTKRTDKRLPQEDPVEGARDTVERELERQDRPAGAKGAERERKALQEQVNEETELPQKGSA
ncbi:hypothetical protein [Mesorhizobium sp. WSM3860]|uniref:hypothetical protein n=1 Tax=Mesorhizobium sp. WSM3860 TaxID=2029403 RepID=UPI000BAF15E7|nr:hypothetical protein [Mesorhizobium sp. WSM3860]PBC03786.1 hypothetical protein CK220_14680 [Mesorhizobium sp. WSM3860]